MNTSISEKRHITILIADDDEEDRMLLEEAFEEVQMPNELRFAYDGEEVFDYLNHRGRFEDKQKNPTPDLIVLDLNMPKKDGREVLELIRKSEDFRVIPVVIMTTSSAEEDINFTYQHGGNSFITKPPHFSALIKIVKNLKHYWFDTVILPATPK